MEFPRVFIEFEGVSVTAKAQVGSAALPTLTNTAKGTVKKAMPGTAHLQEFHVLDDVSGVLKPVRSGHFFALQRSFGRFSCHVAGVLQLGPVLRSCWRPPLVICSVPRR